MAKRSKVPLKDGGAGAGAGAGVGTGAVFLPRFVATVLAVWTTFSYSHDVKRMKTTRHLRCGALPEP